MRIFRQGQGKFNFSPQAYIKDLYLKIAFAVLNFLTKKNDNYRLYSILTLNYLIKNVSKKKFKTSEPFGSALWMNLLR